MGHRIVHIDICAQCIESQLEKDQKVYLNICATYASKGKCAFRQKPFEDEDFIYVPAEFVKSVENSLTNLEASNLIVTTESPFFRNILIVKTKCYEMIVDELNIVHSFCAFPNDHDKQDEAD